ncbi:cobyrinate a,c-diamide synthase [Pseudorhodobacter sp. E13]|uniref:cobyrinate a,c-diamide synthase n=1 Tax=Pseudorhodobacter sp. E13 TaxID=2487931 RepID=UPI000F8E7AC8|nr:cobyrinate a,c-diamide synthase [Pseudorhodobacter sp. E13]RUS63310.1 cobyrinate a,c-diamide synthase [Pseudorhodobacter sp. E13]
MPKGLLISAPASGTGKTTVTLGLLAALRAQGVAVQPFKSGPDYIDPAFHSAASGRASFNLDSWAMPQSLLFDLRAQAEGAELILAEGSMGLFDGVSQPGETGSGASADIATLMGWPVVLVIDVSGQAQSAAAVALGFAKLRPDLPFAGVVLNRVASPRHEALVRAGMEAAGITVFGALPRNPDITLPERHLGLVQAEENPELAAMLDRAAQFISTHLDIAALVAASASAPAPSLPQPQTPPPGQRIALARDTAFSFVYPHLIAGWRAGGATILPFSPLADEGPDDSAHCCWLPGGYPELHAGKLASAAVFRRKIRAFAQTRPVHGECGGYMAMGAALVDKDGTRHEMAGLLGLVTSYEKRKMHLGYRHATLAHPIPGHAPGTKLRGHEFHYSTILEQPDAPLAETRDATGATVPETGSLRRNPQGGMATGTYFHLIGHAT